MRTDHRYRILSISGGGYPGLFAALVMLEAEKRLEAPLHSHFDLIAGTSIGGIIGLGIAAGLEVKTIVSVFLQEGERIFEQPKGLRSIRVVSTVLHDLHNPRHDGRALASVLRYHFGDMRMRELLCDVAVPALRISDGAPVLFTCREHPDLRVVDVALATSAAPVLLPAHFIEGVLYADGGIYANNPDELALDEARLAGAADKEIVMVSVGVPRSTMVFPAHTRTELGIKDWIGRQQILATSLVAQDMLAHRRMQFAMADGYFRIDPAITEAEKRGIGLDLAGPATNIVLSKVADRTCLSLEWERMRTLLAKPVAASSCAEAPAPVRPFTRMWEGLMMGLGRFPGQLWKSGVEIAPAGEVQN